jgi:hypothetical protein
MKRNDGNQMNGMKEITKNKSPHHTSSHLTTHKVPTLIIINGNVLGKTLLFEISIFQV